MGIESPQTIAEGRIKQEGYYGMPFEDLPDELRDRVRAAAEVAKQDGGVTVDFIERKGPEGKLLSWKYGEYTDVYLFDNDVFHASYHKVGDRKYRMSWAGDPSEPKCLDNIMKALGFDRGKAKVIPGLKYADHTDEFARQVTPTGPHYGMKR